ncbi:MAG: pacearchaeosortase [Candidatus Pacearchaeota archaeon]|jgi:exosortase/archaeosortase family protein
MSEKSIPDKSLWLIALRYILLLILVGCSPLIYKILTPLTIYFTVIILRIFYSVSISGIQILINQSKIIEIIPSCVAGSAYVLLLILNLFIAMKPKQRVYSLFFSFSILFILNILRIFILSVLLVNDFEFFYITHKLVWYILSTILVVGVWFLTTKIFSIKGIPIVSDVKYFIEDIKKFK